MSSLLFDIRFAIRALKRNTWFTIVAVATLAIALGANTAIFSVVDAILLRPLPFSTSARIVTIAGYNSVRVARKDAEVSAWPDLEDLRKQSKTLEHLAAYSESASYIYPSGEPVPVSGAAVGSEMFDVLAIKPELGRRFTARDDLPDAPPVIALSHETWMHLYAGDQAIIGKTVRFGNSGKPRTVVAILPPGLRFPINTDTISFWAPIGPTLGDNFTERGAHFLFATGLLRRGVTVAQAESDANVVAARLQKAYPDNDTGLKFAVDSCQERLTRGVRPALMLLTVAVFVVLLIGCANVANLLLARAAGRHREIAVRSAIGATRGRIIRQLLVESVVLSLLAGAIGALLATWGVDLLVALAPPTIPRLDTVHVDGKVLFFTAALSMLTGIIFGLAPAISASNTNLTECLNDASRGSTEGRKRGRLRNLIVGGEIALSLVLLTGAGLLLRSFVQLFATNPGFDSRSVASLAFSPRTSTYPDDTRVYAFQKRVIEEASHLPGVKSAAGVDLLPLAGDQNINTFNIAGRPEALPGQGPTATILSITPHFFETLSIPLLQGRDFTANDTENSERVLIVDQTFVKRYFPHENPIGHQIVFGGNKTKPRTIVGIASPIRFVSVDVEPTITFYAPQSQRTSNYIHIVTRSDNPAAQLRPLREIMRRLDPQQPVIDVRTFESLRVETFGSRRFLLTLTALLALLALVLAAIGIYSIMAYSVAVRTPEIGIRMALGAESSEIFRLIIRHSVQITAGGLLAGVIAAVIATRTMRTLLYGVVPGDPITLAAVSAVLAAVAIVASYIPARMAAKVDPLVAIRYD
ncbi:MAG TPA: ABC transporter permease [Thermoanaerobaculia bacterium]|jgi:putative ABC transport system permease protein